jgi:hypothetical protein
VDEVDKTAAGFVGARVAVGAVVAVAANAGVEVAVAVWF